MRFAPECVWPTSAADFWTALAALATLAAVLAALWPDFIRWRRRPVLKIFAEMKPPACQRTPTFADGHLKEFVYYLRIWVKNTGKLPAENVQVFVESIARREGDVFVPDTSFLPMNLRWTHAPSDHSTYLGCLNPGMGRHSDLCHVSGLFEMNPTTAARIDFDLEILGLAPPARTASSSLRRAATFTQSRRP